MLECVGAHRSQVVMFISPASSHFSLPGVKKPLGQYGPASVADTTSGSAPAPSKDEDDDDIDLFGSDEVKSL